MTRPPRYSNKSDRLITPGATAAEIRTDMACAPLDRAVRIMDEKYGIDVLVGMVSPASAERYGRVIARLMDRYNAGDAEGAAADAAIAIRGLAAMDAEATAAGHTPADPRVWRVTVNDVEWGFVEDVSFVAIAERNNPDVKIVTLRQAANAMAAATQAPIATAAPSRPRSKLEEELNDALPF